MNPRLSSSSVLGVTRSVLAAGFALALVLVAGPQGAAASGPLTELAGNWTGGGTITVASGANERIRCRARYSVESDGNTMDQDLRCASDSYRFDLRSTVQVRGGSISGNWSETSRGVHGSLSGRARDGEIQALAEGAGFSANITVSVRGNQQTVRLTSPGSEVRDVSVSLRRAR